MCTENQLEHTTHTITAPTTQTVQNDLVMYRDIGSPTSSVGSTSSASFFSLHNICLPPQSAAITSLKTSNVKLGQKNVVFNLAAKTKPKKQYQCPDCLKIFSRPSALQTHSYTHTAEKPFKCTSPNCGRSFSVVSNLRRHFKVHQKQSNKNKLSSEDRLRCVRQLMKRSDAILSGLHPSGTSLNKFRPLSPAPVADQQPLPYAYCLQRTPPPSPPPKEQQQLQTQPTLQNHCPQLTSSLQLTQGQQQQPRQYTCLHSNDHSLSLPAIQPTLFDKDLPSLFAHTPTVSSAGEGLFLNSILKLPLNWPNNNGSEQYNIATHDNVLTPLSSSVVTPLDKAFPSYFDYNPYC